MTLNCIIVDDEPLAIKLLKNFIEKTPFTQLQASYLDPMEAVGAINDDVHLLFLDINMPGITGLELSRLVSGKTRIIFTTAFREYALDSYEVNALDYLLKPINYTAFLKAVTKGKEWFEQQERLSEMSSATGTGCAAQFHLRKERLPSGKGEPRRHPFHKRNERLCAHSSGIGRPPGNCPFNHEGDRGETSAESVLPRASLVYRGNKSD
jgi:DNA-binding LytR/AlgR family response regulator